MADSDQVLDLAAITGDLVHGPDQMGGGRAEAIRDYCAEYDTSMIYPRPEITELGVVHAAAYSAMIGADGSVTVAKSSHVTKRLGRMTRLTQRQMVPRQGVAVQSMTAIDLLQRYPLLLTAYPPGAEPAPAKPSKKRS